MPLTNPATVQALDALKAIEIGEVALITMRDGRRFACSYDGDSEHPNADVIQRAANLGATVEMVTDIRDEAER